MTQFSFSRSTLRPPPPAPAQPRCLSLEQVTEVYLHRGPHQVPQGHCPGRGGGGRSSLSSPLCCRRASLRRRMCPWVLGTLVGPRNSQPRILTQASTPPCRLQTVKKSRREVVPAARNIYKYIVIRLEMLCKLLK